jgi:hypothetical protein
VDGVRKEKILCVCKDIKDDSDCEERRREVVYNREIVIRTGE